MIIKNLHQKSYLYIENIGYGNAFRYNSKVYILCSSSKDVPLKDADYFYGMCVYTGQVWKIPRNALVEELPMVMVEYKDWDEANAQVD